MEGIATVNRSKRRKLPKAIQSIADNLHNLHCPDCNNDAALTQDSLGMWHLEIRHDDTCPWLSAYEQHHHERNQ